MSADADFHMLEKPDQIVRPIGRIIQTKAHTICRCGAPFDIGSVVVEVAGIRLNVSIRADGVKWPHFVDVSPDVAAQIEPLIRREWLRAVGERWETQAVKAR